MIAVRLPEEIETRLEKLAKMTGRSKTHYVREAILAHLEDMEDYYAAAEAWSEHRASGESALSAEELGKRLGLED